MSLTSDMLARIAALLTLLLPFPSCAQPQWSDSLSAADSQNFPEAWIGTWEGEITAFNAQGPTQSFSMKLEITETDDPDRWGWKTTYAGEDVRDYTLIAQDREAGAYQVDEHNGIVLESRLIDGVLYTWFAFGQAHILLQEELVTVHGAPRLRFEIVSTSSESTAASEEPAIDAYFPVARQFGLLERASK